MAVVGPRPRSNAFATWLVFVVLTLMVGSATSWFGWTRPDAWYDGLTKPRLNPPDITFAIVWPVLFVLMASGAFTMWRSRVASVKQKRQAMDVYILQMALNVIWPVVFFTLQEVAIAMAVLVLLITTVLVMIARFWAIRPLAGVLIIPYLLWLFFALYLNLAIYLMN